VADQSQVHNFFPDKEIHFTEISGGGWATDFADNLVWNFRNIIIGATRNWARSVVYWNLALDQNDGPFIPGGCSNCRGVVTIQRSTGQVTRNVEYYVLAHASRFVRPGAERIMSDSLDETLETVAFRNPDGSEVLIAMNPNGGSRWFDVVRDGESIAYRLPGRSVVTQVWQPPPLPGDVNGDGFTNADDLLDLLPCMTGPAPAAWPPTCELPDPERGDPDADGDIDLQDFALLVLLIQ
jgi:glucosylceramidase